MEGDPNTVIGLPVERLSRALRRFAPDLSRVPES
jgi:predicted house-cleaning NTP pyrophosphatase (Maf/HAM1 superfamily)